jgi:hypothetical protein
MFSLVHQHVWEVVRTLWPYRPGWGIACKGCHFVLLHGLPKSEVEAAVDRLTAKCHG